MIYRIITINSLAKMRRRQRLLSVIFLSNIPKLVFSHLWSFPHIDLSFLTDLLWKILLHGYYSCVHVRNDEVGDWGGGCIGGELCAYLSAKISIKLPWLPSTYVMYCKNLVLALIAFCDFFHCIQRFLRLGLLPLDFALDYQNLSNKINVGFDHTSPLSRKPPDSIDKTVIFTSQII